LVITYLELVPSPISAVAWTPAPNPGLTGDFAPNQALSAVDLLLEGVALGPEDIARGPDGLFYTGLHDGRILRFGADGDGDGKYSVFVDTGGRPLGMQFNAVGDLIVADALQGLLSIRADGIPRALTNEVEGVRMRFVDDLDIAADGTIWFSDASTRHGYENAMLDFLEARPTGRLLSYDPETGETRVHMGGLFFANGVALGPDDAFVLVNETGTGRIHRLWLKGPQRGERDLFFDGLPGNPDNLSFNGVDTFWVALPALRSPGEDYLAGMPGLRNLLARLPAGVLSRGSDSGIGMVVGLALDGRVVANLQDSTGRYTSITSVNEYDGVLYLAGLTQSAVARLVHDQP
jgi:sugar lactone lactonase YvrE